MRYPKNNLIENLNDHLYMSKEVTAYATSSLKSNKVPGPDNIYAKMLKLPDDTNPDF